MGYKIPNSSYPSRNLFLSQVNFPVIMDRSLYFNSAQALLDSNITFIYGVTSLSVWLHLVEDKAFQLTLFNSTSPEYKFMLDIKIYPNQLQISGYIQNSELNPIILPISLSYGNLHLDSWILLSLEILQIESSKDTTINIYNTSELISSFKLPQMLQSKGGESFYIIGGIDQDTEFYLYEMWILDEITSKDSYYKTNSDCPGCNVCMPYPYAICLPSPIGPDKNLNGEDCPDCVEFRTCDEEAKCIVNCYNGCSSLACDRSSLECYEPTECPSTCICEENSVECSGCIDSYHILIGNICECKEGYYELDTNTECMSCPNNCISCDYTEALTCTQCIDYSYNENSVCVCYNPSDSLCLQSCPQGYQSDISSSPISCVLIPSDSSSTAEEKTAESIKSSTSSAVKSSTTSALTFSYLTFQTDLVWSLVNVLQVFTYIPLLNIDLPLILVSFLKSLNEYSVIPNVFSMFIDYSGPEPFDNAVDVGFESCQFLINAGNMLSIFLVIVLLDLAVILIGLAFRYFKCDCVCFQRLVMKIYTKIHWNSYIRYVIEGYLDISLAAFLQVYYVRYS